MPKNARVAVDIAAVDQFSATLAKARRDLVSTGDAAKLMSSKMGGMNLPSLGFSQAGKELGAFHAQATRQIGSLSRMTPGLGALAGVGSIAGLGEIVARYAGLGVELRNVSRVAGTGSAGMDSMRGAARLLGLSAGTADQAMVGLNKTIADAAFGKNGEAAAILMNQVGVSLKDASGNVAKAEQVLPKLADFMQVLMKSDPRAAVTLADKLGLGSDAINLLGVGAERLASLRKEAAALAGVTDDNEASSIKFAESMGKIGISADRVGRTISTTLQPVISPLLNDLADWTRDHSKEVQETFKGLATGIGATALAIPDAVRRMREYKDELGSVFDTIKRAGESVGADKIGKWLKDWMGGRSGGANASKFDSEAYLKLSPAEQQTYLNDAGARAGLNRKALPDRYSGVASTTPSGPPGNPADPRGIRNNNPLNLTYVPGQQGAIGTDGRFGRYGSMEEGVAAAHRQLQRYQDRGITSVGGMIGRWAPPNENETAQYTRDVARRMGVDASSSVNLRDVDQATQMILAMARKENGREIDPSVVRRGVQRALGVSTADTSAEQPDLTRGGRVPQALAPATPPVAERSSVQIHLTSDNLPPGLTPQISTQGNGAELATVRLRYAMPAGG